MKFIIRSFTLLLFIGTGLYGFSQPNIQVISLENLPSKIILGSTIEFQMVVQNTGSVYYDSGTSWHYQTGTFTDTFFGKSTDRIFDSLENDTVLVTNFLVSSGKFKDGINPVIIWPETNSGQKLGDSSYFNFDIVDTGLGIKNSDPLPTGRIYPNPVRDGFQIKFSPGEEKQVEHVIIWSPDGKVVRKKLSPPYRFNLENERPGIYLMMVYFRDHTLVRQKFLLE